MTHKNLDIREFRDSGLLQEINRQFLHPRGLALKLIRNDDGEVVLGGIGDSRDSPSGIIFNESDSPSPKAEIYARRLLESRREARIKLLGHVIQPVS
jgi:hypothetical protein